MNLFDTLANTAQENPYGHAVFFGTAPQLSWQALEERTLKLAAVLVDRGCSCGDRVGLAMTNCPQFIEVLYACWRLGVIAVPMNAKGHATDFQYMLEHSESRLCFVTPKLEKTLLQATSDDHAETELLTIGSPELEQAIANASTENLPTIPADAELPAWLFYTSGTTGRPKGAILSHRNLLAMAESYFSGVGHIDATDHLVHAAPMSHGSGLYIIPHIIKGAAQVVPESGKFEPEELVNLINTLGSCTIFAAPTMLQRLLDNPVTDELPGLKVMILGGGPLYVRDCMRAVEKFGAKIAQIYGQGETPMTITSMTAKQVFDAYQNNDLEFLGSVGKPFDTIDVKIVDENGNSLPAGESGEILVRGDTVMTGYLNNEHATAETLRDGWLHTGDIGSFNEAGILTLKDRSKDLIISGGTNIYPREVEEVLLQHPDVAEACVVGIPDEEWGESVAAVLVAEHNRAITTEDIDQFCLDHLARFKRPKQYLVVNELPKNATGKVLKGEVRELLATA